MHVMRRTETLVWQNHADSDKMMTFINPVFNADCFESLQG